MPTEFDIIRQYFLSSQLNTSRSDVDLGIGDDAAVLKVPAKHQLVQSVDTLVSGIHFPAETSAGDIAYKALAVNLSDMAAMGAEPAWFTLALTLPEDNETWLEEFTVSLFELAKKFDLQLVGGDTTNGPLTISITMNGFVPEGMALKRSTAQTGDKVYVSGTIGDAALALAAWQGQCLLKDENVAYLDSRLNRPQPRVELGLILRDYASACIDVSDGLIADLEHLTESSQLGARIYFEKIPLSNEFESSITDESLINPLVLSGGDDYELCFTIRLDKQTEFDKVITDKELDITCIGEIENQPGIRCYKNNHEIDIEESGYQHFTAD